MVVLCRRDRWWDDLDVRRGMVTFLVVMVILFQLVMRKRVSQCGGGLRCGCCGAGAVERGGVAGESGWRVFNWVPRGRRWR